MHARRLPSVLLALPILLAATMALPISVSAAPCGAGEPFLGNGGFELPGVAPDSYALMDATVVQPWNTTDVANQIEIWGDGFLGVPAFEGTSFAELNANSAGTLYQDVVSIPGSTMIWTLHHRGRDGTDVMKVLIGDASTANVSNDIGWNVVSGDISDPETAWGTATDTYIVPAGQTCTRFAFRAVSSGVGIESYGNLVDGIAFTIPVDPTPTPTPAATDTPATPATTATPPPAGGAAPAAVGRTPRPTIPPTDALPAGHRSSGGGVTLLVLVWASIVAALAVMSAAARLRGLDRRRS